MKKLIAALLMVLVATPALAARSYDAYDRKSSRSSAKTSKVYIGVSGGQNKLEDTTITKTSTGYSVFLGYAFNDYFATELAYTNFGKLELSPTTDFKSYAGSLSLVGSLPMGRFVSLFGKAGYATTTSEYVISSVTSPSESHSAATFGAGLQFNMGQTVAVRLGYDRFKVMASTLIYDSNYTSLGVMFKF